VAGGGDWVGVWHGDLHRLLLYYYTVYGAIILLIS
jgi:hypothetical protein